MALLLSSRRVNGRAIFVFVSFLLLLPTQQMTILRNGHHQVGFGQPKPVSLRATRNENVDSGDWNEIFADEYRQQIERQQNQEKEDDGDDVSGGKLSVVDRWPEDDPKTGDVAGLDTDRAGNLLAFHRADRHWMPDSFDENHTFAHQSSGPIMLPTVFTLNASNGAVISKWGENLFYLPHGLRLDSLGNRWMTDVALHQVFKFEPNKNQPSLVLGEKFQPGRSNDDVRRFCQPTDVAIASTGEIYVADGYCLSRVLKFDKNGKHLRSFGIGDFNVPHSLALAEELDLICVADRENMRVLCYNAGIRDSSELGKPEHQYTDEVLGRVFAIAYSQTDGLLYGVTGPTGFLTPQGFTIDLKNNAHYNADIIDYWSPNDKGFDEPHAIAVDLNGQSIYIGELNPHNIWKFEKERKEQ